MALDVDPQIREYGIYLTVEDGYGEISYSNHTFRSSDGYDGVVKEAKIKMNVNWEDVTRIIVERYGK